MNETTHVNDTYVWVEAVLFSPRFYPSVCETRKDSGKSSVCADVIESTAWVFRRAPEAMCLQSSSSFAEALGNNGSICRQRATVQIRSWRLQTISSDQPIRKPALPENLK